MGQTSSVANQEAAYFSEGESSKSKGMQQDGSRGISASNGEQAKLMSMSDDHSEISESGVVFVDPTGEKMILNGSSLADDKDYRQHVVVEEMDEIDMEDDDDDFSDSLKTNSSEDAGNTSNSIADTNRPLPHIPSQDSSISTHVPAILEKKVKFEVNVNSNDRCSDISSNGNDNGNDNRVSEGANPVLVATASELQALVPPETALPGLLTLSNSEIKTRLNEIEFDKEMIKTTSQCIQVSEDIFSWYHDATIAINKKDGSIVTSSSKDGEDASKSHMQVAMFILKVSPSIKNFRFKLVPAKLSESNFWNAVFYLIQSRGVLPTTTATTSEVGVDIDIGIGIGIDIGIDDIGSPPPISPTVSAVTTSVRGRSQTNALLQQITKLKEQLADLESALEKASGGTTPTASATSPSSSSDKDQAAVVAKDSTSTTTSKSKHAGTWIMDKESQEFMALDGEIKAKLRDGKQKRLNDVLEQMKFILDSDDEKDSRGKWDCCGATTYRSCYCQLAS